MHRPLLLAIITVMVLAAVIYGVVLAQQTVSASGAEVSLRKRWKQDGKSWSRGTLLSLTSCIPHKLNEPSTLSSSSC